MEKSYQYNKSVGQGIKILELLSEQGALTDIQVSQKLNLNLHTVQQLILIYKDHGYIVKEADGSWNLSIKVIEISRKFKQRSDIKDLAKDHLISLSDKYHETSTLGALEMTDIIYIDKVDSVEPIRFVPDADQRITAHHTAVGKSILAYLPVKELNYYCHFAPWAVRTQKSIGSKEQLLMRLEQIKKQGFAICDEEYTLGLRSIAVPILDSFNYPRHSIGIWGITYRMTPKVLRQMQQDLTDISLEISKYYTSSTADFEETTMPAFFNPPPLQRKKRMRSGFLHKALGMFF